MKLEKFLENKLVKTVKPDFKQIELQMQRAQTDLKTAQSVHSVDLTWSYAISYHAMMRASKALMYSKGYLPTAQRSHKTIVEFAKVTLGTEYEKLILRFNRMRRQRHNFIYDAKNSIDIQEANTAMNTAKMLIEKITEIIKKENPQIKLL